MKKYFINNNSDTLLLFFTGWGCDEKEFEHLRADSDVLLLYEYSDLNLEFDFSKYKEINLIAFSAGVFIASVFDFKIKLNRKIAISGNPYLFDEHFGLSKKIQEVLYNVTEETADDFARNYLVKTDDEWQVFHHSQRTIDSCKAEFDSLKRIYQTKKQIIKDIYDTAIAGDEDPIFNVLSQKEFFKDKLRIVKNARHNVFFRIKNYKDILYL